MTTDSSVDVTGAEAVAASAVSLLAAPIVLAYFLDRFGLRFTPGRLLVPTVLVAAVVFASLGRSAKPRGAFVSELCAFAGVVMTLFAWLMWMARPAFLPLGGGPDLTHHLLLIGFIESHWTLVHDPSVEGFLGEMVHYTPGSQILAALAGAWTRTDGLHAAHALVAATVALKAGLVLLISLRVLPQSLPRIPLALLSVCFLLVPRGYVLGSFVHDSFFAQVVGECFVVALWWILTAWDRSPSAGLMALFSLIGAATFLTWPVWIGAPMVSVTLLVLARRQLPLGIRAGHFLAATLPVAFVAALYIVGRLGWIQIVRTGGSVVRPSVAEYGWWFLGLSAAGLVVAAARRQARVTVLFAASIGLEIAGLFLAARSRGPETPYMALKMFYLLVYPQAVAAALAVAVAIESLARRAPAIAPRARACGRIAWLGTAVAAVLIARPIAAAPAPNPAISEPLVQAAAWARQHVPAPCVDYLVSNVSTAYWLHLSALGNPRMSSRTGDDSTFDQTAAIIRWLTPGGLPYAIAELPTLPADVRSDLDVVADFGTAAVVKRRGPASCPPSP